MTNSLHGNEEHIMLDGSSHKAADCPSDCKVRTGLESLLAGLASGTIVMKAV